MCAGVSSYSSCQGEVSSHGDELSSLQPTVLFVECAPLQNASSSSIKSAEITSKFLDLNSSVSAASSNTSNQMGQNGCLRAENLVQSRRRGRSFSAGLNVFLSSNASECHISLLRLLPSLVPPGKSLPNIHYVILQDSLGYSLESAVICAISSRTYSHVIFCPSVFYHEISSNLSSFPGCQSSNSEPAGISKNDFVTCDAIRLIERIRAAFYPSAPNPRLSMFLPQLILLNPFHASSDPSCMSSSHKKITNKVCSSPFYKVIEENSGGEIELAKQILNSILSEANSVSVHQTEELKKRNMSAIYEPSWLAHLVSGKMYTSISNENLQNSSVNTQMNFVTMAASPSSRLRLKNLINQWDFHAMSLSIQELLAVSLIILEEGNNMLSEEERIESEVLNSLVRVLYENYREENPYHNFWHAVDVLQCTYYIFCVIPNLEEYRNESSGSKTETDSEIISNFPHNTNVSRKVGESGSLIISNIDISLHDLITDPIEIFALFVAALGHDVSHPGVTNAFLVEQEAPVAILYNDRAVLESMHAATLFSILRHPRFNIAQKWSRDRWRRFRSVVTAAILSTDMSQHFYYVEQLSTMFGIKKFNHDFANLTEKERDLIAVAVIKFADICNVIRPFGTARKWGFHIVCELFNQGDWERVLGHPSTSSMMKRTSDYSALAAGQIYFLDIVSGPLFRLLADRIPSLRFSAQNLDANINSWREWRPSNDPVFQEEFSSLLS